MGAFGHRAGPSISTAVNDTVSVSQNQSRLLRRITATGCHVQMRNVCVRQRRWPTDNISGVNAKDDFELRAPAGTSAAVNRRRTQSSPAWLPQCSQGGSSGTNATRVRMKRVLAKRNRSHVFIKRVGSCLRDCFYFPVELISNLFIKASPKSSDVDRGLENEVSTSIPSLLPISVDDNDEEFLDEDVGAKVINTCHQGDNFEEGQIQRDNDDTECLDETCSVPEEHVPGNALIIQGRVVKGSRYRNSHRPCPFTSELTPSPELLAGRQQRNKKHQRIPSGESASSLGGCEPMAVRKAMLKLQNAREHCIQAHYEEEYRKNFVAREWKDIKRRMTPNCMIPKPDLVRSKGSLT
uniref:Uncharacterized protein n=1 Tax=Odontella aurita TaxID=265563 RepID=A0A7S4NDZ9_9STRA|mmetsp:Transcript_60169/g.178375  ORF Transcript_60169/g.178375 Transcript_60169/m.178375 type:complete len:352 (+) Transcript_60169:193-1248(+)